MKAAVFRALCQPLVIEDVPEPCPAPDELVIRVGRCGICGSDLHMTQEPAFGISPGSILGHEFAGEIVDSGRNAEGFKRGDLVAVSPLRGCGKCATCRSGDPAWCEHMMLQGGGYAEYALVTARQCLKLPASTSIADGALVEPLAVALHAVALSGLTAGARVLVLGAGPIGLAVAFWARQRGATRVAVADLTTLQEDLAHRLGATSFVKAESDVLLKVHSALGGPPDIVFECVGKPGILAQALEHVRVRGSIVMLGLCTSADSFVPFRAVSKEVRFITSAFFNMQEYQVALDKLDGGQAQPRALVTDTVSLSNMPVTFEALRQRSSQCKVLVSPD
ncbi:MAG: alcohol dehydrogenase catalytic domain-containing protein [Acidobacteriota bacterium]|nr:alcohol dehydrogenase catalytic domain-containing protein [Acidobacteriota bacterium]